MPRQLQIRDHLRIEQRHRVARHRIAEARMKLFRDRRAADDIAPLQHQHLQPGLSQIRRANEPVMAPADDDNVVQARLPPPSWPSAAQKQSPPAAACGLERLPTNQMKKGEWLPG